MNAKKDCVSKLHTENGLNCKLIKNRRRQAPNSKLSIEYLHISLVCFPFSRILKNFLFSHVSCKKSNLQHHHFLTFFAVFAWDRPAPLPQQPRFSCNFCRFLVQHREMINIFLRKRKKLPKAV